MNYKIIKIKKSNNKYRTLYVPDENYKNHLKSFIPILEEILHRESKNEFNYAFTKGKNCAMLSYQHIGFSYTLKLDIVDFFDSIKSTMLEKYIPTEIIEELLIDGAPRQGLPTSPIISSIAMIDIDKKISQIVNSFDQKIIYTRYADDLIFSSNDLSSLMEIKKKINFLLNIEGFKLNNSKTRIQSSKNGNRVITGISVSEKKISPTRKTLRKLRAALHKKNTKSAIGLFEWSLCKKCI